MVAVLIVEDELAHAELIRRAFEAREEEFDLTVVPSLKQARAHIAQQRPELVITDLVLPDGRGIDLIPNDDRPLESYPVVVMTSHGDETVAVEAIKAGALDYVVKSAESFGTMPHVADRTLREWRQTCELERTQQQLRHAQKMEAIGNLSSGIAHDFNNLLMGITGCTDVALSKLDDDDPARRYVAEIKKAALRGSSLTRQLLAFSRKREADPRVVDFNLVVEEAKALLRPLLSEDIAFDIDLSDEPLFVRCDPGQVEQTLVNLVVNARDAMPNGGEVSVTTKGVELDEDRDGMVGDIDAGEFAMLAVTDTGEGMDEETLQHIFEPFFTTKDVGQGTGLGLSTIYGIVKQSHGEIAVDSTPGRGTTFKIYLPRTFEEPEDQIEVPKGALEGHGETVLVVEDESLVRLTVRGYLERGGYHVMTAKDGTEALALAEGASSPIDLLVTDMVLPGLKGPDIARQISALQPGIKVLFMSAHPPEKLRDDGRLPDGVDSLQKPFTEETLLLEVQRSLYPERLAETSHAQRVPSEEAQAPRAASTAPGDGPCLLLIEDHVTARWTTRELLEDEGYRVLDAGDGATALELMHEHGDLVDLVISDMRLPDVDGVMLAEQLRGMKEDLSVLFTSGTSADDPQVQEALEADKTAFLAKPVGFDTLVERVEELLDAAGDERSAAQ